MVPALALSGFTGPLSSLVVIFGAGNVSAAPLLPLDAAAGAALASNVFQVAAAFMLLTIGARDVPSAEVSLYMLIELCIGRDVFFVCFYYRSSSPNALDMVSINQPPAPFQADRP